MDPHDRVPGPGGRTPRPRAPREPADPAASSPRRDPARRFGPSADRGTRPAADPPAAADPSARLRRGDLPPRERAEPVRRPAPREGRSRDSGGDEWGPPSAAASAPTRRPRPERPERPDRDRPDRRDRPRPVAGPDERTERTARAPAAGRPARDPAERGRDRRPDGPPARPAGWRSPEGDEELDSSSRRRGLRIAVTVLSVLVFALSGTAWAALSGSVTTSKGALDGPVGDAADGATDILLVGVDSRTDAQGQPLPADVLREIGAGRESGVVNTDTMILVRIPNDGSRAVAFSIPRDSYVSIPGTLRRDKINSAYPGAKAEAAQQLVSSGVSDPREVDVRSSEAGRAELVKAVASLTGLTVDHFGEVNLLGFYNLTTAIGGVNVCLKEAVDDELSGARFRAGPQSVSGRDALAFVRQRHGLPQGDLDRIRRQQAFLAGLSNKVLSAGTLADPITLTRLLGAVQQSVVLDGGWDVVRFAQQMQGVSAGAVAFLTIPTEGTESVDGRGDVIRVDPETVQRFVADAIGQDAEEPAEQAPAPATIPIDIRNASGTEGAAGRVVAVLSAQGYAKATSGNAEGSAPTSTVLFGPGADAAGARVAGSLGGLPARFDPSVLPGAVRVLLASDYRGPGGGTGAPPASTTGSDDQGSTPRAPAPPPAPAITAEGVPCVA